MREEYDFSNGTKNPYAERLKKQVTINLDIEAVAFFKEQSAVTGLPYQTLINLYLSDCAKNNRQLHMSWE